MRLNVYKRPQATDKKVSKLSLIYFAKGRDSASES